MRVAAGRSKDLPADPMGGGGRRGRKPAGEEAAGGRAGGAARALPGRIAGPYGPPLRASLAAALPRPSGAPQPPALRRLFQRRFIGAAGPASPSIVSRGAPLREQKGEKEAGKGRREEAERVCV